MGVVDFSHGGNIYEIEQKYRKKVIDFSANINPLGPPPELKDKLYKNMDDIIHYPDLNADKPLRDISDYWGIGKKNVLLGNGSAELIYLIFSAFRPETVLIPAPTFSEYERAGRSANSKIDFLKLKANDGFRSNPARIKKKDVFFLCHPNNPTGNFILDNPEDIGKLAGRLTVIDEAFMDFLPDEKEHSFVKRAAKSRKMAVLRTFTKMFALPGLRIGYIVSHKDTIEKLRRCQPPWNTNSLAQSAAGLVLEEKEHVAKTIKLMEEEKKYLFREISAIKNLSPYPSLANFILIKINSKNLTSSLLQEKLISEGILIRDCANFRGLSDKYIRTAVRTHRENSGLIRALKRVV